METVKFFIPDVPMVNILYSFSFISRDSLFITPLPPPMVCLSARRPSLLGMTELEMLLAYSPFLKLVEQAISSLKAAINGDVSRPEI